MRRFAAFFIVLALCQGGFAQDGDAPPPEPGEAEPALTEQGPGPIVTLDVHAQHAFRRGLENGVDGEVASLSTDIGVGAFFPSETGASYSLGVRAGVRIDDFNDTTGLLTDAWRDLYSLRLSAGTNVPVHERLSIVAGAQGIFAGEHDADAFDSLSGIGHLSGAWKVNDRLTVGGGLGVRTRLEDDLVLFPSIIVTWQISERWSLGTQGRALALTYDASDRLRLRASAGWYVTSYRLGDDSSIPEGVVEYRRVPLTLEARWALTHTLLVEATAGLDLAPRYDIDDRTGDELLNADVEAQPFLGVRITKRF